MVRFPLSAVMFLYALALGFAAIARAEPPSTELAGAPSQHAMATHAPAHAVHWGYEGPGAPENWGKLSPDNTTCSLGKEQSPIDLKAPVRAQWSPPEIAWTPVNGGNVVNNGHTLQMDLSGAGGLVLDGTRFDLKQFHFHHPSEHTIEGRSFPLEVHFVHAAPDGRLAVIGVLFEEGAANPGLEALWATAPTREGKAVVTFTTNPGNLLPADRSEAFRYQGSLTTPPCSETVTWTVLANPIQASAAQIQAFATLFPNNARPIQPLNRRFLLATP